MTKFKKGQVSAKRAYEMADSLSSSAATDKYYGNMFMSGAKNVAKREKKTGVKEVSILHGTRDSKTLDGSKGWEDHAKIFLNRATHNTEKANRYRANADKAMTTANAKLKATSGRDTPLPSSDGIIGTITNKISELFK